MNAFPLVSIIVITYNSAKYVLETLESAKNQTYQNIELIISDDCSSDNTVAICQKWIIENRDRFITAELITTNSNTGISANCNRGMRSVTGKWSKLIAGDDILLDNCIEDNILFINNNLTSEIIYSKPKRFGGDESSMQISENNYLKNEWIFEEPSSVQLQKQMERTPFWYTATLFIKTEIWAKFEFDEAYPNIEDTPFVLKCLKAGHKLFYFPIYTVGYRFGHSDSVQNLHSNKLANFNLYRNEFFLYDIKSRGILFAWNNYLSHFIGKKRYRKYKFLLLLSPYFVFYFILRHLGIKNKI